MSFTNKKIPTKDELGERTVINPMNNQQETQPSEDKDNTAIPVKWNPPKGDKEGYFSVTIDGKTRGDKAIKNDIIDATDRTNPDHDAMIQSLIQGFDHSPNAPLPDGLPNQVEYASQMLQKNKALRNEVAAAAEASGKKLRPAWEKLIEKHTLPKDPNYAKGQEAIETQSKIPTPVNGAPVKTAPKATPTANKPKFNQNMLDESYKKIEEAKQPGYKQKVDIDYSDLDGSFDKGDFGDLYYHWVVKGGKTEDEFANLIAGSDWVNGPRTRQWLLAGGYFNNEDEIYEARQAAKEGKPVSFNPSTEEPVETKENNVIETKEEKPASSKKDYLDGITADTVKSQDPEAYKADWKNWIYGNSYGSVKNQDEHNKKRANKAEDKALAYGDVEQGSYDDYLEAEGALSDFNQAHKDKDLSPEEQKQKAQLESAVKKAKKNWSNKIKTYDILGNKSADLLRKYLEGDEARADAAEKDKKSKEEAFKKDMNPNLLKKIFGKDSGANLGQRLLSLGKVLLTMGTAKAGAQSDALNGREWTKDELALPKEQQILNEYGEKNRERYQKSEDTIAAAEREQTDRIARIQSFPVLQDLPENIQQSLGASLGSETMSKEAFTNFLQQHGDLQALAEKAGYDDAATFINDAYEHYTHANNTYAEGNKRQNEVIQNETGRENLIGTRLANKGKQLSNKIQKNNFITECRNRITELRQLQQELNAANSYSKAVDLAARYVGIYAGIESMNNSTNSDWSASAAVSGNIKVVNAEASGAYSRGNNTGVTADVLAKNAIPSAEKLSQASVDEWNNKYKPAIDKAIQEQIREIEGAIQDIRDTDVNDGIIKAPHMKQWLVREDGTKIALHPSDTIYATKNKITSKKDDGEDVVHMNPEDEALVIQKKMGYQGGPICKDSSAYIKRLRGEC